MVSQCSSIVYVELSTKSGDMMANMNSDHYHLTVFSSHRTKSQGKIHHIRTFECYMLFHFTAVLN